MIRRDRLLRRAALPAAALAAGLLSAAPAHAASKLTITGRGWGHGIGMSQYGAMGYAEHGWDYAAILGHYYSGTSLGHVSTSTVVRVLLQTPRVASFTGASRVGGRSVSPSSVYRVARGRGGTLVLQNAHGHRMATFSSAPLIVTGPGPLTLRGTADNGLANGQYRGWLELRPTGSGVQAVNGIGLEQYVAGVVSAESPSSWPLPALEAQAVAARSYAVTTSAGSAQGFDQYADTRSQMYLGVAAETPSTNQAVNGTRGEVVTYDGTPVTAFFFSTSGGRTEDIEDAWVGSAPRPWLRSVDDPYDYLSPHHIWQPITMSLGHAQRELKGLVKGRLKGIRVDQRGVSPRVVWADVVGTKGSTRVTGPDLRSRLGLMDTWMYFTAITTNVKRPSGGPDGATTASSRSVLRGSIMPARRGTRLAVQRRDGRRWVAAGHARVGRGGAYAATVRGPGLYRVVEHGIAGPNVRVR